MPRNECTVSATPEDVWGVLAEPRYYGHWVVGSKAIRDWDDAWPAEGTRFHHVVGWGPLRINDHTEVEASAPPQVLRIRAKARPFGTFIVTMQALPDGEGQTRVIMDEEPADRLTRLVFGPLSHLLVRARNFGSLERLKDLAEGRGPSPEEAASEH